MGALDNFKTAAKSLFSIEPDRMQTVPSGAADSVMGYDGYSADASYTGTRTAEYSFSAGAVEPNGADSASPSNEPEETPKGEIAVVEPQKNTSVIAKGTTVVGRIRTDGHLEIMGKMEGNVDAEGDVAVQGRVMGNVKGNYLGFYSCNVKGNLTASSGVIINSESVLVGDVQTDSIVLDGKLKGNVSANQTAVLKSNAYLLGDITAHSISIETGAVVNGMITTLTGNDDTPFDVF